MSDQPMTATERNTLIRITKQRFKLLHQGLYARQEQLRRQLRDEIVAENKKAIEDAKKRVAKVSEKAEKLWDEYTSIISEERANGLSLSRYYGRRTFSDSIGGFFEDTFTPEDLASEIERRMEEIVGDKPVTEWQLQSEEARILEAILVGNLKTGESQRFLDSIPTLESLIPLTNGNGAKAIEA